MAWLTVGMADHEASRESPGGGCTTGQHVRVTGDVQGVYFRGSARAEARELSLTGWVRNADDGSVELLVGGEGPAVDALIRWCHDGPDRADVEHVEHREATAEELATLPDTDFDVRR